MQLHTNKYATHPSNQQYLWSISLHDLSLYVSNIWRFEHFQGSILAHCYYCRMAINWLFFFLSSMH